MSNLNSPDPDFLVGEDRYVLDCNTCPLALPTTVASLRHAYLQEVAQEVTHGATATSAGELMHKVVEWIETAGIETDHLSEEAGKLGLVSANGVWQLALSEELREELVSKGMEPDMMLINFNDQQAATRFDEMTKLSRHVFQNHPGKVVCGGTVEVNGRMLCGASLETTDKECVDEAFASAIVLAGVRNELNQGQ